MVIPLLQNSAVGGGFSYLGGVLVCQPINPGQLLEGALSSQASVEVKTGTHQGSVGQPWCFGGGVVHGL